MQHRNITIHEKSSPSGQANIPVSARAFVVRSIIKPLSALGIGFLSFVCPTAQINQPSNKNALRLKYYSRKKKYLRSKMFSAVFTSRRDLYLDPLADIRRARR